MLAGILTLFGGPFGGFMSGILGSGIGAVTDYFKKKQQIVADAQKYAHEVNLLQMNIDARGKELENEAMIAQIDATAQMLGDSYTHDASYGQASQGVVNLLRMIRPALTFMMIILMGVVYFFAVEGEKASIIGTITYLSEVAFTWWFADRARGKK